jgi:hypothetical protein
VKASRTSAGVQGLVEDLIEVLLEALIDFLDDFFSLGVCPDFTLRNLAALFCLGFAATESQDFLARAAAVSFGFAEGLRVIFAMIVYT